MPAGGSPSKGGGLAASKGSPSIAGERAQFGFSNDQLNLDLAVENYSAHLAAGDGNLAPFPMTEPESATFRRWQTLIDDPRLDAFVASNQQWFAEKEPSFDVSTPGAKFYLKKNAPAKLFEQFRALVPQGLAADLVEARWSGDDLEKLKERLAGEADDEREGRSSGKTIRGLADDGVRVVYAKRRQAQRVELVIDTDQSPVGPDASGWKGEQALDRQVTKGTLSKVDRDTITLAAGKAPKATSASRESDPGQIKAGVALNGGGCTSNVSISYGGNYYLVTAGHCVPGTNSTGSTSWVGDIDVSNYNNDGITGVSHGGLYIGNMRKFQFRWASGRDIALIQYIEQDNPTNWPQPSAAGLATGLYTLTDGGPGVVHHYGINSTPTTPTSGSYVCFEGASAARYKVTATNGYDARYGNRCGTVRTSTYSGMQEITGPNAAVCGGDSGGLVHSNDTPIGIVAYGDGAYVGGGTDCQVIMGYSLLSTNLAAWPGATILGWGCCGSGTTTMLAPESSPGSCVYRHNNGNTGGPGGGWLAQVPHPIYWPTLGCTPDVTNTWRFDPNNGYASGDVYNIRGNVSGFCMQISNYTPSNWDILIQQPCDGANVQQQFFLTPNGDGSFYIRPINNGAYKCVSIRDPYTASDPHWIHIWDCIGHPAQRFRPRR